METIEEVEKENPLTKNISESQKIKIIKKIKMNLFMVVMVDFQKQKNLKC